MTTEAKHWDTMIDDSEWKTLLDNNDRLKKHRLTVIADALRRFYPQEELDRFNPDFERIAYVVRDVFVNSQRLFEDVDEGEVGSDLVHSGMRMFLKAAELLSYYMPQTAAYREALHLPKERSNHDDATQ